MVMYFNPLKVLMPVGLGLLAAGFAKAVYDVAAQAHHTPELAHRIAGVGHEAPLASLVALSDSPPQAWAPARLCWSQRLARSWALAGRPR